MKYAREYVKRYSTFVYRRAIGLSMATFAVVLASGMLFTFLAGSLNTVNVSVELVFWLLLMLLLVLTIAVGFASAHLSTIKHMTISEHKMHTKYVGVWLVILVIGVLVFSLPFVLLTYGMGPSTFLLGFGGMLWVLYLSGGMLFRQYYHEIAFGAAILWGVALVGVVVGTNFANITAVQSYRTVSFVTSVLTLVIVFGFIGLMLLFNSTRDFTDEIERPLKASTQSRTRRRRRR